MKTKDEQDFRDKLLAIFDPSVPFKEVHSRMMAVMQSRLRSYDPAPAFEPVHPPVEGPYSSAWVRISDVYAVLEVLTR